MRRPFFLFVILLGAAAIASFVQAFRASSPSESDVVSREKYMKLFALCAGLLVLLAVAAAVLHIPLVPMRGRP